MSTFFVEAVDAELAALDATIAGLVAAQRELTPRIFILRSQRSTLETYRRTLALDDLAAKTAGDQEGHQ